VRVASKTHYIWNVSGMLQNEKIFKKHISDIIVFLLITVVLEC